jgi:hypothetical protein
MVHIKIILRLKFTVKLDKNKNKFTNYIHLRIRLLTLMLNIKS